MAHVVRGLLERTAEMICPGPSMSSSAASGGYWLSVSADRIIASPATITGSIGIFGMLPTYQRTIEAMGVGVDGVGSTIWAGEFRLDRKMSEHAKDLFQLIINDGYDDFISFAPQFGFNGGF